MESGSTLDSFELGDANISTGELPSRAWIYLKKLHNRKEEGFQKERSILLETCAGLSKTVDLFAVEMGLLSYEISRAFERQNKGDGDTEELSYLKNKIAVILKKLDVAVEDPTGAQLEGALLGRCEVVRNTNRPDVRGHVVGEAMSPMVSYRGKLVHLAEVIGWIGEEPVESTSSVEEEKTSRLHGEPENYGEGF